MKAQSVSEVMMDRDSSSNEGDRASAKTETEESSSEEGGRDSSDSSGEEGAV